ncbi:MAG TPA: hypothetical protein VJ228_12915 [Candidatus Acidoferrales bacterium]|nr:hypothetical protein [Candidatus Acidoferrales bacterium]
MFESGRGTIEFDHRHTACNEVAQELGGLVLAVGDEGDAGADFFQIHEDVRGYQNRNSLLIEALELIAEIHAGHGVEAGGWFIEKQHCSHGRGQADGFEEVIGADDTTGAIEISGPDGKIETEGFHLRRSRQMDLHSYWDGGGVVAAEPDRFYAQRIFIRIATDGLPAPLTIRK